MRKWETLGNRSLSMEAIMSERTRVTLHIERKMQFHSSSNSHNGLGASPALMAAIKTILCQPSRRPDLLFDKFLVAEVRAAEVRAARAGKPKAKRR